MIQSEENLVTDGRIDGPTDAQTDRQTDRLTGGFIEGCSTNVVRPTDNTKKITQSLYCHTFCHFFISPLL